MTVATTTNVQQWLGNGSTTVFSYSFPIELASQITLLYTDASGNQTSLTPAQYSVTGIGVTTGGTITYPLSGSPIASGTSLTLIRTVELVQGAALANQGGLWPTVIEEALDFLTYQTQQLNSSLLLTIQLNPADQNPQPTLPPAAKRANQALVFDNNGNPAVGSIAEGNFVSSTMIPFVGAANFGNAFALLASVMLAASPNVVYAPQGNTPSTLGTLVVQAATSSTLQRQFLGSFGLLSNSGHGVSGADKVALYAAVEAVAGSSNIWALNTVTAIDSTAPTDIDAQGYELDFNNNLQNYGSTTGPSGIASPFAWGLALSGASSFTSTSGIIVSGVTTSQWYRGLTITGSSVYCAIADYSAASNGIEMIANHAVGINMQGSSLTTAILIPNTAPIEAENGSGTGQVQIASVNGSNILVLGAGANVITMENETTPGTDNSYSIGASGARWSAVWAANGTIQTSDPSLKTDIKPLPSALPILDAINPVTFKWINGGNDPVETTSVQTVQDTETVSHEVDDVQMVNGKAVLGKRTVTRVVPAWDMVPVYDAQGNPVFETVPAKGDKPEIKVPRMHRAPRMVTKEVTTTTRQPRAGRRTHAGFLAPDVAAAMHLMGGDWGAYVKAQDGTEHLRPDQMVPVLWKAAQEMAAKLAAQDAEITMLKAMFAALEAAATPKPA